MEYSNRYSLLGLWENFILKLKYALLLFIRLEIEVAVKSRRTVRKLRKYLSESKLENSIGQVLRFLEIVR